MNEYFPEVAWRTIVDNVTVAPTPHYYTVDVFPLDSNEPGADPLDIAIGYWLIDNGGYTYLITDVSGSTITVYDINERSWGDSYIGPLEDLPGYVYKTKNGAFLLSQSQLRFLDKSAPDILYPIEKGIIWKYRGIEINALYGDGEVPETITEDSVDNITKLSLSSEFILRTEEDGWQGGKKYSLSLDGFLHNTLPGVQGTGSDGDYIHLDQDQIDALWTKDGLNITRDSAASLTGILSVDEIKSHTDALPLIKKDGNNVRFSTCILSDCVNNRVGIFTETPLDHLHLTGYARISTLAETANSSIVTSNADGRLIKLPYDNDEGKYLRSDGTWVPILTSVGDFLDSVIRMVVDSTFNPGTPTNGDRYIILNASSIHANFGTINKFSDGSALTLGNNDIVQYFSANSEFRIVYDSSAAMQPATVTVGTDKNGNTNHQWTYNVTNNIWVDRGAAVNHNSLDGLNDGDYKHLNTAQYTNFISLTDGSDISNTLHNHNTVYYTKTSIDAFFAGTIAKTGYNKSNWDTVVTDFAELEIGGRNLLKGTNNFSSNYWSKHGTDSTTRITIDGDTAIIDANGSTGEVYLEQQVDIDVNTQYTLSALVRAESVQGGSIRFYYYDSSWKPKIIQATEEWQLFSFTFKPNSSNILILLDSYKNNLGKIYFKFPKLEKGNKATDWTPAPEDQVSDWNTTDVDSFSFIKNKPSTFAPSAHSHLISDITNLQTTLNNKLETSIFNTHNNDNIRHITGAEKTKWDTAYTERNRWDGGATGLNATTGRTSLGLGTAATHDAQTSLTDTTAGRLMEVGAFGLGIPYNISNFDTYRTSGSMGYGYGGSHANASGGVNPFPTGTGQIGVINIGRDINYMSQIAVSIAGFKFRNYVAPNWGPWRELYHTGNLTSLSQLTDNIGVTTHITNKANPHLVTTAQIGAVDLTTNQNIGGVKTFTDDVGIGNTSPTEKLDVTGNIRLSGGDSGRYLTLTNVGGVRFTAPTSGGWASGLSYQSNDKTSLGSSAGAYGTPGLSYYFYGGTYSDPYAVILPNRNVGIGTTSPQYKLDVNGAIQSIGLKVGTLSGLLQASSGVVSTASIIIQSYEPSTAERTEGDIWVQS